MLNEYQRQAARTSGAGHDRLKNGCLGLIGESGEVVDIVKKFMFQSGVNPPLPVESLINEMGDILWYCAETASGIGRELGDVVSGYETHALDLPDMSMEALAVELVVAATDAYALREESEAECLISTIEFILCLLHRLCGLIGTTISHVALWNIKKLAERYPDGFDPERSANRAEYRA